MDEVLSHSNTSAWLSVEATCGHVLGLFIIVTGM